MRLENTFSVPAPPERAWALLRDVPCIIPCMPGAELVEAIDENRWKVVLHVKLGPIALQFSTDLRREEADDKTRIARLSAKARELRGRGNAQATIQSSLSGSDAGTEVTVVTDLSLQGAIAQYGRGILADVASQLTRRFADCLAAQLREADAASSGPPRARPQRVHPIGGLRLALGALWRFLLATWRHAFHRRRQRS